MRSMDCVMWYNPSQAFTAKHVSYPQLSPQDYNVNIPRLSQRRAKVHWKELTSPEKDNAFKSQRHIDLDKHWWWITALPWVEQNRPERLNHAIRISVYIYIDAFTMVMEFISMNNGALNPMVIYRIQNVKESLKYRSVYQRFQKIQLICFLSNIFGCSLAKQILQFFREWL